MEECPLSKAANLKGRFVYGIKDLTGFFYIGKTTNPAWRFFDNCRNSYNNLHLLRRIREAGPQATLVIIERDPVDLDAAEQAAIVKYSPQLTNIQHNPFSQERIHLQFGAKSAKPICAACDAKIAVKKSRYCYACLGALLGKRGGQSKRELRDLCKQIQIKRSGGCVIKDSGASEP